MGEQVAGWLYVHNGARVICFATVALFALLQSVATFHEQQTNQAKISTGQLFIVVLLLSVQAQILFGNWAAAYEFTGNGYAFGAWWIGAGYLLATPVVMVICLIAVTIISNYFRTLKTH